MKWPFLSRLKTVKKRTDKVDVKKTRRRYTKAQLLDLLCTTRTTRSVTLDTTSYLSLNSTNATPTSQLTGSLSDLLLYHSLVLRQPIPDSKLPGKHSVECANSKQAYCPTCRDIVIPLPQKRRSNFDDVEYQCLSTPGAKKIRACLNELELAHLHWQQAVTHVEKRGHFNPTYEAHQEGDSGSIYSDVYDSTCSDDGSIYSAAARPKLVGVRRRKSEFRGSNQGVLRNWLLTTTPIKTEAVDSTYATVYEDGLHLTAAGDIPGEPWSSSTLKRVHLKPREEDNNTVYDDVASEFGDSFDFELSEQCPRFTLRRRLSESPYHANTDVKRVRREFFVCEE